MILFYHFVTKWMALEWGFDIWFGDHKAEKVACMPGWLWSYGTKVTAHQECIDSGRWVKAHISFHNSRGHHSFGNKENGVFHTTPCPFPVVWPSSPGTLIFCSSFVEIQFTYHAVHPFKVYNSVILVYSQNCATITTVNFRTFSSPQKEVPYPLAIALPFPPNPSSPRWPLIYFLSVDLPILDISYKCNHTICDLLWLVPFTNMKAPCFHGLSNYSMYQYFVLF